MNPLQGINQHSNTFSTIINASDKSEQALRAIKIFVYWLKDQYYTHVNVIIRLRISWMNQIF